MSDEIKQILCRWLELIDEYLAHEETPLETRISIASDLLIKHAIEAVDLGHPKDPDEKINEMHAFVIKTTEEWYKNIYGNALEHALEQAYKYIGLILIRDTPFELKIPLTIREENPDGTYWLKFPYGTAEGELLFNLVSNGPNISELSEDAIMHIENEISEILTNTRRINLDILCAHLPETDIRRLANSVLQHLTSAVQLIISLKAENRQLAIWDLHFALEKSLKTLHWQRNNCKIITHKLSNIRDKIGNTKLDSMDLSAFSDKEAIEQRYNEGKIYTTQELFEKYKLTLNKISDTTSHLKYKMSLRNGALLINTHAIADVQKQLIQKRVMLREENKSLRH